MEDLLGLSWDSKATQPPRAGGAGLGPGASGQKATPPPPVKKPVHLQMGLSKGGLVPTPASSSSFSSPSAGSTSSPQQPPFRGNLVSSSALSSSPAKKTADDVFGSLVSSFGQSTAGSDLSKSLSSMTLEERRRHDQLQQQQQYMGSMTGSTPTSLSGYSSPALSSASSFSYSTGGINGSSASTISQPTAYRPAAFGNLTNNVLSGSLPASSSASPAPLKGYDPGNLGGFSPLKPTSSPSPHSFASPRSQPLQSPLQSQLQPLPGMTTPVTQSQNPLSSLSNVSPGGLGRSMSPAMTPLQPERSRNASPASTLGSNANSKDPFDMLLGDQVSRSSPALKNQSLNSIRYNTPPLGQAASTPKTTGDPWDLDFLANATGTKEPQPANNNDVFDLGAFEKAPPAKPTGSHDGSVDALSSFIGKQPSPSVSPSSQLSTPVSRSEKVSQSSPSVSSREEGDIAQIVAMGFSADRAKLALSMTENGRDIEAAIEYLIQNDEAQEQLPSSRRRMTSTTSSGERTRSRRSDGPPDLPARSFDDNAKSPLEDGAWRAKRSPQQPSRDQQQELSRAQQLQQQKDKLVGTASIFGMSVLSKANEFYKQGREKVQAVMEDITAAPEDSKPPGIRRHEWIDDEHKPNRHSQYKDSDSEDDEVFKGRREQQQQQQQRQRQQQSKQQEYRPRHEKETFQDAYVSSSRRGGSTPKSQTLLSLDEPSSRPSGQASSKVSSTLGSSNSRSTPGRTSSPLPPSKPKPSRQPRILVQANPQQVSASNQLKEKGNESFKLGQFGQAAEFYARAGQALPSGHLLLIVTQNNRAAALLKIGEYRETVTECDRTIIWIQGPDGQGVNDTFSLSSEGTGATTGVQLKDQMGKALMRRASAYENLEKFKEAKEDWARLRELDPSHKNAVEGHRRCEKALAMVSSGAVEAKANASPALSRPAGRTPTATTQSSPMQDLFASNKKSNQDAKTRAELERSEGVSKLRQSAAQQEQEDDEKLRLRDQVDRKMALWKSGKEDNVRALIASLSSVLWEGAGWKAVGMHELVTPQQVKIKYIRAIGKMHPDKLGASTTVEQRMMANTIFSTLNSAWDAFKVQNNM